METFRTLLFQLLDLQLNLFNDFDASVWITLVGGDERLFSFVVKQQLLRLLH